MKNEELVGFCPIENKKIIFIIVCTVFASLSFIQLFMPDFVNWDLFRIPIIIIGIVALWMTYDMVVGKYFALNNHRWLATTCQFTFFIYLFHEPTLNVVRKLIVVIIGKNDVGYLVSYLLSPWIFIIVSIPVATFLKRHFVSIYKVCVGYRI